MAMAGREVMITALNGKPVKMIEGEFHLRESYSAVTRIGNPVYYIALSDREKLYQLIARPLSQTCEIVINQLSRDECEVFPDPTRVAFKGGPDNCVHPGSAISWWHTSTEDYIEDQVKSEYARILRDMGCDERILSHIPLATSPVFKHDFSGGYIARLCNDHSKPVPQARYHSSINNLICSYKRLLNVGEVEFRIHGTTFYKKEIMHSVLICPGGSNVFDVRFPKIEVGTFTAREQCNNQSESFVSIERNEEGEYRVIWRPFSTKDVQCAKHAYYQWDKLAFAFFLPNGYARLQLPLPYKKQEKWSSDPFNNEFGQVMEVTGLPATNAYMYV